MFVVSRVDAKPANLLCSLLLILLPFHLFSLRSLTYSPFNYNLSQSVSPLFMSLNSSLSVSCFFSVSPPIYTGSSLIFIHRPISLIPLLFLLSVHQSSTASYHYTLSLPLSLSFSFFYRWDKYSYIQQSSSDREAQRNSGTSKQLLVSFPSVCSLLLCPQFTFRVTLLSEVAATVTDKKRLAGFLSSGDYCLV